MRRSTKKKRWLAAMGCETVRRAEQNRWSLAPARLLLSQSFSRIELITSDRKYLQTCTELYQSDDLFVITAKMGFNPMKWKTRTIVQGVLGALLFYILFVYKKKHQVMFEATVNNSNPKHVWEFVADFSNMKKLNPTIEDFNVIAESGNYDHWKYSVQYTEHLSHLPMIRNVAHGHYAIKPDNNGYVISSKHRTCFFFDFNCLESVSQFRFDADGAKDTKCIETVQYECPIAFSPLCYREVMYQREEIMKRLKSEFNRKDT